MTSIFLDKGAAMDSLLLFRRDGAIDFGAHAGNVIILVFPLELDIK
jgi:hypothetical protein